MRGSGSIRVSKFFAREPLQATALELYGKKNGVDVHGTVCFIKKVLKWWTIINVKTKGLDQRHLQPQQAVISNPDDERFSVLEEFGEMCLNMRGKQGKRIRQLSNDTAKAIHQTCFGLVYLSKNLLQEESYSYVCLGEFSTDRLEKAFSKFRQGSGGCYFINAQQITEKLNIQKAKLQLSLNCDVERNPDSTKHKCASCEYSLDESGSEVFDSLPDLESSVNDDVKTNLVHIAGYVVRKKGVISENWRD